MKCINPKEQPMYNRKDSPLFNDWCQQFKLLDTHYGTDKRSPLHHDNRCECNPNMKIPA